MKILIAVKSCHRDRYMHQRIMETWGHAEYYYDWVDLKFFVGHPILTHPTEREVSVSSQDDYDSLTSKLDAVLNWFTSVSEYTHIFVCDTDTYVDIPKLVSAFAGSEQYVGYTGMNGVHGAAHGGPGFWLSSGVATEVLRRATRDNVQSIKQDEWWVYELLQQAGINPVHDDRYSLLTTPDRGHDCITYHNNCLRDDPGALRKMYDRALPPGYLPQYMPHPLNRIHFHPSR